MHDRQHGGVAGRAERAGQEGHGAVVQQVSEVIGVVVAAVLLRLAEMYGGGGLWEVATMKLFFITVFCLLHPLVVGPRTALLGFRAAPKQLEADDLKAFLSRGLGCCRARGLKTL